MWLVKAVFIIDMTVQTHCSSFLIIGTGAYDLCTWLHLCAFMWNTSMTLVIAYISECPK